MGSSFISGFAAVNIANFVQISFAFVSASYATFIVRERAMKQKHQQTVSGLNAFVYWGSNFAWDFLAFLLPFFGCLILFQAFQIDAFTKSSEDFWATTMVLLLYGASVIPFTYCLCF